VVRWIEPRSNRILAVMLGVLLLAGIVYASNLGPTLRFDDEREYLALGVRLAKSHRFSYDGEYPTAHRAPGYPFLISLLLPLGAGYVQLRILNFVALALSIYLLHRLLREHASPFAATAGAVMVLGYPVLCFAAGTLYPQTIGGTLLLAILLLLTRNSVSTRAFVAAGLLFACLILMIPTFAFTLVVLAAWIFATKPAAMRQGMALTLAVALLPVGLWCARNYVAFHTLVFINANSGEMLLYGNSEHTRAAEGAEVDISRYTAEVERRDLSGIERDAYYRAQALAYMRTHKLQTAEQFFLKFFYYFSYRNQLATKREMSVARDGIMLLTYGPLLLLFVGRLLMARRWKLSSLESLLVLLYLSNALFAAVFMPRLRYRLPYDFLPIGVVAVFLDLLVREGSVRLSAWRRSRVRAGRTQSVGVGSHLSREH
jgi:hypothetical protein